MLNPIFLNCFWFAYLNVPSKKKKAVLKLGRTLANKCDLSGHPTIDALRAKNYSLVDTHKSYTLPHRLASYCLAKIEGMFGCDLTLFKKMIYHKSLSPSNCDNSIPTTNWVNEMLSHYDIEKWHSIYDVHFKDLCDGWASDSGLYGGKDYAIPSACMQYFKYGSEFKVLITLWGCETSILHGAILNEDHVIFGTSIFDGTCTYNISIDFLVCSGKISVRATNVVNGKDYSEHCRILYIKRRVD